MQRKFMIRISVVETASANGPTAIFGSTTTEKILDASVRVGRVEDIRNVVDGLLYEGIPDTQREDEKDDVPGPPGTLMRDGASGQVVAEYGGREGPSDFPITDPLFPMPEKTPVPEELKGGKHSGHCRCSGCEPILPGEIATIQVPPVMKTRPIRDNPQA